MPACKPAQDYVTLSANEVDIWHIGLAAQSDGVQQCRGLLTPDEVQRADRFYFEEHRSRFTVSRAAMREILSRYVGRATQDLYFAYGPKGKPELSGDLQQCGIKFSMSHSSELALLAVTRRLAVGVDIERVNAEIATEEIAQRFFSATELQTLRALPSSERVAAFFSCWTRKEAYIKALGCGLSVPLDSFAVAFAPGIPAALLHVKVDPTEVERWSMYNIQATPGYEAALVVEGKGHRLQQMEWSCSLLQ